MARSYCGIILAAGEGRRLRPFIRRLRGDALPKQYVHFSGRRSMLERTIRRAERIIHPDRLFTVVSGHHLDFAEAVSQLAGRSPGTVIVQPQNRETGPGILLPLVHVASRFPGSTVVVFPSDHFVQADKPFVDHVERACRAIEQDSNQIVLLGVQPDGPEAEYGYILPGRRRSDAMGEGVRRIMGFFEKPKPRESERLVRDGALWNTFVMVFRPGNLLDLVRRLEPGLHREFLRIQKAVGTPGEQGVTEEVYQNLEPLNFSKDLLERIPPNDVMRVTVIPVRAVGWSDWGSEQRLLAGLRKTRPAGPGNVRPPLGSLGAGSGG